MGLLYKATKWLDHVTQYPMRRRITNNKDGTADIVRAEGDVIQQGTPRNAKNYNNMRRGFLQIRFLLCFLQQRNASTTKEQLQKIMANSVVTIKNTNKYPFSSASITVPIKEKRSNLDYVVQIEVSETDGNIETIEVFDKQLNGFKLAFKGSAKNVKLKYKVTGGRY